MQESYDVSTRGPDFGPIQPDRPVGSTSSIDPHEHLPDFPSTPHTGSADALNHAIEASPHASMHREVADKQSSFIGSTGKGLGRVGALVAGVVVAAATKFVTLSGCLASGGIAGVRIPISLVGKADKAVFDKRPSVEEIEKKIKAKEELINKFKEEYNNRGGDIDSALKAHHSLPKYAQLKRDLQGLEKEKKSAIKQAERQPKPTDTISGKVKVYHQYGMTAIPHLEAVSNKLFEHALGKSNPKLEAFNAKVDRALGKTGTAIGVATGATVTVGGMGIATAVAGVGAVCALVIAAPLAAIGLAATK